MAVEGRGVGVTESGDIWYDAGSADPIRVTARSGWLVNGRESVTFDPSSGTVGGLNVRISFVGLGVERKALWTC